MANNARVLGIVLMHATGTSAGVFEMLKDKVCVYQGHVSVSYTHLTLPTILRV